MRWLSLGLLAGCLSLSATSLHAAETTAWKVHPAEIQLTTPFEQFQLLVTGPGEAERATDLTHAATYRSSNDKVVKVGPNGRLLAVGNGTATITVTQASSDQTVAVKVTGNDGHGTIGFTDYVIPILSKAGCNAGACHASQHGKGGFRLSVFAFDPQLDHESIVRDRHGRRANMLDPDQSLILLKPTLQLPHGGNQRIKPGSSEAKILAAWLASGAPGPQANDATVTSLELFPPRRVGVPPLQQQVRVLANYSDGRKLDVTSLAQFDSMDDAVANVTPDGLITAAGRGQGPILVRFRGQAQILQVVVPYTETVALPGWQNQNFIDELAVKKFRELGLEPSPLSDDATFVRRAYLDAIGTLPTPAEAAAFIASNDPHKRDQLVDRLLGLTGDPQLDIYNNAYASYWALKWADLLRCSSTTLGEQGMWSMYNWIRESMRTNKPFDRFTRELITAQGSIFMQGPANFYKVANDPAELAETTSQVFLGVRLQCAKCHHHPFEKYAQEDYYGLAAFFARVGNKTSQEFGLFGRETVVVVKSAGEVRHPKTGKNMQPTPLEGTPIDDPLDRRRPLADWLTNHDNHYFPRNVANRYMSYLLGTALVEPVDDLRATNPASNPELLDALAEHFVASKYDLKQLIRVIMKSRLYQLDSQPTPANATDRRFYSHYAVKRIPAEPLLDAIDSACGTQTKFTALPLGTRAIDLPDGDYPDYFLKTFGKPRRAINCECERVPDANLAQTLHVLNGEFVSGKVADARGRIATMLKAKRPTEELVNELFLAALSRKPSAAEWQASQQWLAASPDPKTFYEDLLWSLINSKEFLFVQ